MKCRFWSSTTFLWRHCLSLLWWQSPEDISTEQTVVRSVHGFCTVCQLDKYHRSHVILILKAELDFLDVVRERLENRCETFLQIMHLGQAALSRSTFSSLFSQIAAMISASIGHIRSNMSLRSCCKIHEAYRTYISYNSFLMCGSLLYSLQIMNSRSHNVGANNLPCCMH